MKRSIVLAVILVLIVGVVAGGAIFEGKPPVKEDYWDNLPEAWKFNFTTFGQFGARNRSNANFQIAGFIVTKESGKRFYKETWPEQKSLVEDTVEEFDNPLLVYVDSYGNSSESFDPTNFTFSQHRDSTEYSLTPDRITGFDPDGEVMSGILEVPEEIDVKESFFIHYRYDSAQVYTSGYFTESPYPEEESEPKKTEGEETESKESKVGAQQHNYNFEDLDYENAEDSWKLGAPWVEVANNKLTLWSDGGYPSWSVAPVKISEGTRVEVTTSGKILDGTGYLGIICGYQEDDGASFYALIVDVKEDSYMVTRLIDNEWRGDTWETSSAISKGSNKLKVEVSRNNDITFYINDTQVKKLWGEDSYKGGQVGVYVESSSEERVVSEFEYLKLKTYQ